MTHADPFVRETPPWFDEAKLGCFIHWNPATIGAYAPLTRLEDLSTEGIQALRRLPYAEMYWNTMLIEGSPTARYHAEHFGELPYDAFVDRFRDEMIPHWSPEPLADLISRAGARYAVLFTMTEDGFLMWPSDVRNPHKRGWQSERDVVGELGEALRARDVRYGLAYSGGMDWTFTDLPMRDLARIPEHSAQSPEYLAYAEAHWRELIDRYEPAVLWNDYSWPRDADVASLFRYYFERVPEGVVNNRWDDKIDALRPSRVHCDFLTPEYSVEGSPDLKWEACRGLGTSFGFNRQETEETYLSSEELIHLFVDVVARGGNLLINVAPTATGAVPFLQAQRLLDLGWWLRVNGDAIYATRPWTRHAGVCGDGLPLRFTASGDAVHAIVLGSPARAEVELDVRLEAGAEVRLEGRPGALRWEQSPAGVRVTLPEIPDPQPAIALRLTPAFAVHSFQEV